MAVNTKAIGASMAAVMIAAGIAAPTLIEYEGWKLNSYPDPALGAKLATVCAGVTEGIELGKRYTSEECQSRTAQALIKTGFGIAKCLPAELPPLVRASFTLMSYNIGIGGFCGSTTAKRARAGDLAGSCAAISLWNKAGGKVMPGLVKRRAAERALCESGLT